MGLVPHGSCRPVSKTCAHTRREKGGGLLNCSVPAVSRISSTTDRPWENRQASIVLNKTSLRKTHIDVDCLAVRVLDGRVVGFDPDILDELGCGEVNWAGLRVRAVWTLPVRQLLPTPPVYRRRQH